MYSGLFTLDLLVRVRVRVTVRDIVRGRVTVRARVRVRVSVGPFVPTTKIRVSLIDLAGKLGLGCGWAAHAVQFVSLITLSASTEGVDRVRDRVRETCPSSNPQCNQHNACTHGAACVAFE